MSERHKISFGFVKPHAYQSRNSIEFMITESGLYVPARKDPYIFTREIAERQYEMHKEKHFFEDLIKDLMSNPAALFVIEGNNSIERLAKLTGDKDSKFAGRNTIRGRFGSKDRILYNAFHRSDSLENVRKEILLHFKEEELPSYIVDILRTY